MAAPYAISLVKNGPNPNAGKLWLNFIMSEAGQTLSAQGFVRPAVPGTPLSADVAAKMPAAPQIRPLDVVKASERKAEVDRLWGPWPHWAASRLAGMRRVSAPGPHGPS